jgi:hypothetical protein
MLDANEVLDVTFVPTTPLPQQRICDPLRASGSSAATWSHRIQGMLQQVGINHRFKLSLRRWTWLARSHRLAHADSGAISMVEACVEQRQARFACHAIP